MKIDDVSLALFPWEGLPNIDYGPNVHYRAGAGMLGLLEIRTDEGAVGHAFLGSANRAADRDGPSLIQYLKPLLIGQDPLDRERLNAALWSQARSTTVRCIGAVDVALWDLAGKIAGMPIHRLLGSCRTRMPVYASSYVLPSASAYAEEALAFRERGYGAYKLHIPSPWREDIRTCQAVRAAVGDEYTLMLDASWTYDYPTALRVGRAVDELGFHWLEDPLSENDIYNYVKLRQKLTTPILATELPFAGFDQFAPWIMARATDFLRGDVAFKGGITTLVKAAHLAEAFRMNLEIHHGGNSLNNIANLHVMCAIRNCEFYEVLLPDGANRYGLAVEPAVDATGHVTVPEGPGLGAAIDFALIERTRTMVLR